jgi:glycosyltransferase involved in cell wall biosynthesis
LPAPTETTPHVVSIVIPVYQGEQTLPPLIAEIAPLTMTVTTARGTSWRVAEVILVFGQHSATLAGIASSGSEWVVTLDEDGQHNPADIGALLDAALDHQSPVVYAKSVNPPPHGAWRNLSSRAAKRVTALLTAGRGVNDFQSYRLMLGEIGRSVAAYAGSGVYLDIALGWVAPAAATADVVLREEGRHQSGYSRRKLVGHFWRLVLSSGTRALRIVSIIGVVFAVVGIALAIAFAIQRIAGGDLPAGWASIVTIVLVSSGAVLFSLGIIAEYLGFAVNMAMGKPPYLIVTDLRAGPLGRPRG